MFGVQYLAHFRIPEGYSLGYMLMPGVPAARYTRTVQKKAVGVTVL